MLQFNQNGAESLLTASLSISMRPPFPSPPEADSVPILSLSVQAGHLIKLNSEPSSSVVKSKNVLKYPGSVLLFFFLFVHEKK